jgi:TRAP-type transport system small permease protein
MQILENGIAWLCKALLWASTSIIFFILVANTILRYVTGSSLQWANEVPELLFPWLVMAGVVLASIHGAHITTSFLMDKLAGLPRKMVSVSGWLMVSGLYATLTLATWRMLGIVHDEKSPILGIPGSVTYACVMIGMLLLSLLALMSAWKAANNTGAPEALEDAEPAKVHW